MNLSVSVIIPVYNGDRFIAAALTSVLQQTYGNWELIIIDDGSTDTTCDIVQAFCQRYPEQISYHYQPNQGVGAARNRGIQMARGTVLAFLDQDDYYFPDKLRLQVAQLEAQPQLGIVNSGWQMVDAQGAAIATVEPWHGIPVLDVASWFRWKPVFLGAMLFRRFWLEQGFDPQLQQTGDVELVLRLALMGCPSVWVPQVTVAYRQHQQNASRDVRFQSEELQQALDQVLSQSDLPQPMSGAISALRRSARYQSLVWSAWRLYDNGYLTEMAEYLHQSIAYGEGTRTETVLDWIEQWQVYAAESGRSLNVLALSQLKEWQELMRRCLLS